jgi:hypothetical protein
MVLFARIHLADDTLDPLLIGGLSIGDVVAFNLLQRCRLRHLEMAMEFLNLYYRIIHSTAANSNVSTTFVPSLGQVVVLGLNS